MDYSGKPSKPNRAGVIHLTAVTLVAQRAHIASERLGKLLMRNKGRAVSFEHIIAYCGYDGDLLMDLEAEDSFLLAQNHARIARTITSTLERCVPSPDRPVCSDGPPTEALRNEISSFTDQYLQLLSLSYCDIPRVGGQPPSSFVSDKGVGEETDDGLFITEARLVRGIRRTLEKRERDRYVLCMLTICGSIADTVGL
jgi:hypothetical protein